MGILLLKAAGSVTLAEYRCNLCMILDYHHQASGFVTTTTWNVGLPAGTGMTRRSITNIIWCVSC